MKVPGRGNSMCRGPGAGRAYVFEELIVALGQRRLWGGGSTQLER